MAETLVLHLPNTITATTLLSAWFLRLVTRSTLLGQMSGTGLWASDAPRPIPPLSGVQEPSTISAWGISGPYIKDL